MNLEEATLNALREDENDYIEQEKALAKDYQKRVTDMVTPEVVKNFGKLKEILEDGSNIIEQEGFYFPKEAIEVLKNTDRRHNLNSFMDLTIADILNMVGNFDTPEEAVEDLFKEYKPDSALAWGDNFITILDKLDFDIEQDTDYEDFEESKDLPKIKMKPRTDDGTNYKKIDIYVDGKYWCSTNAYKTIKSAIENISKEYPELEGRKIKGYFAESKKVKTEDNDSNISDEEYAASTAGFFKRGDSYVITVPNTEENMNKIKEYGLKYGISADAEAGPYADDPEYLDVWGDLSNLVKLHKEVEADNDLYEESKEIKTESVDWNYFNKFDDITNKYMPDKGEGETLASQIVTAVNKLVYKWYNDGDVYDNVNSNMDGWANDLSDYANWLAKYAPGADSVLRKIFDIQHFESESKYEDLLKELADLLLDENLLSSLEKEKQGSIYDCKGPFQFSEHNEDGEWEDDPIEPEYDEDEDLEESKALTEAVEEHNLSKDLFGAEAERRLSQEQKDLQKDLQYVRDIMAGKEVIDDKYHEKLSLDTAKKWLRKDFVNVNCLASADPDDIDKKLAKEYPDIFGKEIKTEVEEDYKVLEEENVIKVTLNAISKEITEADKELFEKIKSQVEPEDITKSIAPYITDWCVETFTATAWVAFGNEYKKSQFIVYFDDETGEPTDIQTEDKSTTVDVDYIELAQDLLQRFGK